MSSSSSTSSEEGICVGTNIAKKKLFTNGDVSNGVQNNHVVIKQRTSPRKTEEKQNSVKSEKGPKKKWVTTLFRFIIKVHSYCNHKCFAI